MQLSIMLKASTYYLTPVEIRIEAITQVAAMSSPWHNIRPSNIHAFAVKFTPWTCESLNHAWQ